MLRALATVAFAGMASLPLAAQAQVSIYGDQGIPVSSMPPPGTCRVWYDGLPPSQQPPIVNCRDAERIVAGDRRGRVIYGGVADTTVTTRVEREVYTVPSAMPSSTTFFGFDRVAFENGYHDGYQRGREDARDRDGYDPASHGSYRDADHRYDREYGSRDRYKAVFRSGFLEGYSAGFGSVTGITTRTVYIPR